MTSSAVPQATSIDDPRPVPPVRPDLDDCCHSGCSPCVFDLYDEAVERYEIALAEWQARQAQRAATVPEKRNARKRR
ncbi:oxidoreductase-like domain-containing protein [Paraburkholderia dilworthii]|uniref:oxidoreductase-like domain-containing protein n=1 Tax=Paraburkholderia dilworthii TaxID=948106 RepID=UPI001FCC0309|nr:oxidoreductase-like domain-containing protein [Paraburkholderia dilworthii]